jgi:hypothetical protein
MKIRLLVPRTTNDGAQNVGDVIEVSAEEAESVVAAGHAELVRGAAPEKAAGRGPKPEKAA